MENIKFSCYEIHRPNIPQYGCNSQCSECEEKELKAIKEGLYKKTNMNPQELRVGNLVKYDNREFQLYGVNKDYPFLDTEEFGVGVVEWNDLEPIPLTEERLVKFGWEWSIQYQGLWNGEYKITENHLGGFRFHIGRKVFYLDSVHQLQNLYFALTGKELEIK